MTNALMNYTNIETVTIEEYDVQNDNYTNLILTTTSSGLDQNGKRVIFQQIVDTQYNLLINDCYEQEQAKKHEGEEKAAQGEEQVAEAEKAMKELKKNPNNKENL